MPNLEKLRTHHWY